MATSDEITINTLRTHKDNVPDLFRKGFLVLVPRQLFVSRAEDRTDYSWSTNPTFDGHYTTRRLSTVEFVHISFKMTLPLSDFASIKALTLYNTKPNKENNRKNVLRQVCTL